MLSLVSKGNVKQLCISRCCNFSETNMESDKVYFFLAASMCFQKVSLAWQPLLALRFNAAVGIKFWIRQRLPKTSQLLLAMLGYKHSQCQGCASEFEQSMSWGWLPTWIDKCMQFWRCASKAHSKPCKCDFLHFAIQAPALCRGVLRTLGKFGAYHKSQLLLLFLQSY